MLNKPVLPIGYIQEGSLEKLNDSEYQITVIGKKIKGHVWMQNDNGTFIYNFGVFDDLYSSLRVAQKESICQAIYQYINPQNDDVIEVL